MTLSIIISHLGGCPIWFDVHRMRVWLSPPTRMFFRTLMIFSLMASSLLGWQRVASYDVSCFNTCVIGCCAHKLATSVCCKVHASHIKFFNLVNMIMSFYDCEFFLHDLVIKHGGICTNTVGYQQLGHCFCLIINLSAKSG